jgi:hypothetical protein
MTKTLKAAALLALSFAACAPAQAEESVAARAASAVGTMIAAQGNAALMEIRRDVKDTLGQKLKPLLPQPAPAKPVPAKR